MAVVISKPVIGSESLVLRTSKSLAKAPGFNEALWTVSNITQTRIAQRNSDQDAINLTRNALPPTGGRTKSRLSHHPSVTGIRCIYPVGIVTFEDIIDTILQKTTRDEKEFFQPKRNVQRTKSRKLGDLCMVSNDFGTRPGMSAYPTQAQVSVKMPISENTLRRRNVSNKARPGGAMDGADERVIDESSHNNSSISRRNQDLQESSYTQNSVGGFHGMDSSASYFARENSLSSPGDITKLEINSSVLGRDYLSKAASLSRCDGVATFHTQDSTSITKKFTAGTPPRHPLLHRATSWSPRRYSGYMRREGQESRIPGNTQPIASVHIPQPENVKAFVDFGDVKADHGEVNIKRLGSTRYGTRWESARKPSNEIISRSSWYNDGLETGEARACFPDFHANFHKTPHTSGDKQTGDQRYTDTNDTHADFTTTRPLAGGALHISSGSDGITDDAIDAEETDFKTNYDGFPPKLLDKSERKQSVHDHASETLPHSHSSFPAPDGVDIYRKSGSYEICMRQMSFHDDRALLPSQQNLQEHEGNITAARSFTWSF